MSTLKIQEMRAPCIIQALSGDQEYEREFTLIYSDGHVAFLRRPECADYWLHEEYGTQLQEIKEEWATMSEGGTLYDLLGEGKAWNTEIDDPAVILPNYKEMMELPAGTLVILDMEFPPELDIMRGLIFEPKFLSLICEAEKALRSTAAVGEVYREERLNQVKELAEHLKLAQFIEA